MCASLYVVFRRASLRVKGNIVGYESKSSPPSEGIIFI
jgi:hypothetical protein